MTKGRLALGAQRLVWGIAAGISLLLALRSIQLAYVWSRPIPFWDQWEFFKRTSDVFAGRFGFADLIAQHNEHRIATSRAVFILDLLFFDGSSALCIVVLYVALALIAALMASCWAGRSSRIAGFCLFLGFLLSPAQWENLTSGFQVQFPFVDLFALASLACLIEALDRPKGSRSAWAIAAAASVLDLLAVFSMASGLLTIVPAIWAGIVMRTRSRPFLAYLACHGLYCALFMFHYAEMSSVAVAMDPVLIVRFIVVYLGACLHGYADATFLLGSIDLCCLGGAVCWMLWRSIRNRGSVDRVQVFATGAAMLMVANAAVTAVGRASLGLEAALSSRYSLQSIVMQVALFTLLWRFWNGRAVLRIPPPLARAGLLAGILGLSLSSNLSPTSREEWQNHVIALDKAGFAVANAAFTDDDLKLVYPWPDTIRDAVAVLASRKLGPFSRRFGRVYRVPGSVLARSHVESLDGCTMAVDTRRTGRRRFDVDGWAYDPGRPTGNGWILVLDRSDQDRIVGYGRQSVPRPDVDKAMNVTVGRSGFDVSFNAPDPAGNLSEAFALVVVPEDASQPSCMAAIPDPKAE